MFEINWTPEGKISYSQTIQFASENSNAHANKIIDEVIKVEKRLSKMPFLGGRIFEFSNKNIRRITILENYSLLYRVFDDLSIYVIYFWDNRQNPKRLNDVISK